MMESFIKYWLAVDSEAGSGEMQDWSNGDWVWIRPTARDGPKQQPRWRRIGGMDAPGGTRRFPADRDHRDHRDHGDEAERRCCCNLHAMFMCCTAALLHRCIAAQLRGAAGSEIRLAASFREVGKPAMVVSC